MVALECLLESVTSPQMHTKECMLFIPGCAPLPPGSSQSTGGVKLVELSTANITTSNSAHSSGVPNE